MISFMEIESFKLLKNNVQGKTNSINQKVFFVKLVFQWFLQKPESAPLKRPGLLNFESKFFL